MRTIIIVAMTKDRLIGRAGGLPWHVPADLKHFKNTTMGHAIIMGRKTYASCGKPLPGRRNIVISRSAARGFSGAPDAAGTSIDFVGSLDKALGLCRDRGEEIAFIAGGAQIYKLALPVVDEMIVTYIDGRDFEGDTYFPAWNDTDWVRTAYPGDPSLQIVHYRRKAPS